MSVTTTVEPAAAKAADRSCRCRFGVFAYDLAIVFVLLVAALIYTRNPEKFPFGGANVTLSIHAMWFGALGGIVISLKGIYDHCCNHGDWDNCFNLWHIGRPISGALTGLITLVLLLAINPKGEPSEPIVYAIAFIFGTQERRFFNFLSEVAGLVVRVPNEDGDVGLKGGGIQPSEGKAGSLALISGRGFAPGASVMIGGKALEQVVVGTAGTTIVGVIPTGAGAGAVDVTVTNPGGERVILSGRFTYTP